MWTHFLFENLHFAINIFGALSFFCIFWLHWDAWKERKILKGFFALLGFILLSLAFLVRATVLESTVLVGSIFGGFATLRMVEILKSAGYLALIIEILINPISKRPTYNALFPALIGKVGTLVMMPILSAATGYLYIRRATLGLENHFKRIGLGFFIVSISDFFGLLQILGNSKSVALFELASPFGAFWITQNLLLVLAFIVFAQWGFSYLFKRFESQLFMIFTSVVLAIFLITTLTFTSLLLRNIQENTLKNLEHNAEILLVSIESKKAEALSDSEIVATNPRVSELVIGNEGKELRDVAENFLLTKKQSSLTLVDSQAVVLARGENREQMGDSLSSDPVVKMALLGRQVSSIVAIEGVIAPTLNLVAATPIRSSDGAVVGAVVVKNPLDSAFLDSVKSATGLEIGVFAGDKLSASSIKPIYGSGHRAVGIVETNKSITSYVLGKGVPYSGASTILNTVYISSYLPIKDMDQYTAGMLFVGSPETVLLQTASRSIEFTFIVAALMLVLSVVPAYLISRHLSKQL